jgi:hypothetical protein
LIQGYGKIQVLGGNGSSHQLADVVYLSGSGSGGRIAVYFADNKTYSGTFDSYGGMGAAGASRHVAYDGSPGTMFFYHTGE